MSIKSYATLIPRSYRSHLMSASRPVHRFMSTADPKEIKLWKKLMVETASSPASSYGRVWRLHELTQLYIARLKYPAFDAKRYINLIPSRSLSDISEKLAFINDPIGYRCWRAEDDIEALEIRAMLDNVLTVGLQAKLLNKHVKVYKDRFFDFIQPLSQIQLSGYDTLSQTQFVPNNKTELFLLLRENLLRLYSQACAESKDSTVYKRNQITQGPVQIASLQGVHQFSLPKTDWTEAEDRIILEMVDMIGPERFDLIVPRLPGRSYRDVYARYTRYLVEQGSRWSKNDDRTLLRAYAQNAYLSSPKLSQALHGFFPNSPRATVRKRLSLYVDPKQARMIQNEEDIQLASAKIATMGHDVYLKPKGQWKKDFPWFSREEMLEWWAFHEPKHQIHARWTPNDDSLVFHHCSSSLRTRSKDSPLSDRALREISARHKKLQIEKQTFQAVDEKIIMEKYQSLLSSSGKDVSSIPTMVAKELGLDVLYVSYRISHCLTHEVLDPDFLQQLKQRVEEELDKGHDCDLFRVASEFKILIQNLLFHWTRLKTDEFRQKYRSATK